MTDMHESQPVGASVIRDLRMRAGFSQREVAERMGVSQPTVARWEAGKQEMTAEQAVKLDAVLHGGLPAKAKPADPPAEYSENIPASAPVANTPAHIPAGGLRRSYPAAPVEVEARKKWVKARNLAIQQADPKRLFSKTGVEGKGVAPGERKAGK